MNLAGLETKYRIVDEYGNLALNRTNLINNKEYKDTLQLGVGCYSLIFTDTGDDGIDFWAK